MDPTPAGVAPGAELHATFGEIDIYLFDQLLRGRFDRRRRILDAGCGDGRNLPYFLSRGFDCYGVDRDPSAVARVRLLAARACSASLRRSTFTPASSTICRGTRRPWMR